MSEEIKDAAIVKIKQRITHLREAKEIQCSPGNYDVNEYMRGMANGLILALAIMEDDEPRYFEHPEQTLREVK